MFRPAIKATGIVFWALTAISAARADTIYYTKAEFDARTTGAQIVSFDGIAPSGGSVNYGSGPLTLSGVTFTGSSLSIVDPGFYGFAYSDGGFLSSGASPGLVSAALPSVTAVGFNLGGLFNLCCTLDGFSTFEFTLSDGFFASVGIPNSYSAQDGGLFFLGITSDTPLTSIDIRMTEGPNDTDAPDYNAIDNFTIATALPEPVPEPSSLAIAAAGLGLIWGMLSLKRKRLLSA
jgi:hypothetical protein